MAQAFSSLFVTSQDGLKLHVREYGSRQSAGLPVVCLPGLTRTSADFHRLASTLADDPETPRRVLALDYRGRGKSDYDRNADNYTVAVELDDVLAVLVACDAAPAVFVGTSRGGLIVMTMAAVRPRAIAGVVLNDIGPVIELQGLLRIKNYVGKLPEPRSFEEGAEVVRRLFDGQFPKFEAGDWLAAARRTWHEENGRLVLSYDVRLADGLASIDPTRPLPSMWPQFEALAEIPMMVIRGAKSDILLPETVKEMRARRRQLDLLEVPDQGHAPVLVEPDVIRRIAAFVRKCEDWRDKSGLGARPSQAPRQRRK
jgi:pimeloyl-ACP methyl ester carboxylesterase